METGTDGQRERVIEREQGFWNARGQGSYDRIRALIVRSIGEFSSYGELDRSFDPAGLEVLDYGCGQGDQALTLVTRGARHVTGFDIAEAEVDQARRAAERANVSDRTTFLVADAHDSPFADASFDLVVGRSILHHLELEPALREIRRVLRPGGRALFVEPLWHNPLLRLGRLCTPSARTVDEHPLTERDWEMCATVFPHFEHFERELASIPLMPLNLLLPRRAQQPLASAVQRLDARLMARFPGLRKFARLTFLVFSSGVRG
jgi:ubiquinone/menaquinone biosynthesis C-methylase UbiE